MLRRLFARFFSTHTGNAANPTTLFVPIRDAQGHVTGMMDRLTMTYLQSPAPDPSQRTLDALLDQVTCVRVIDEGAMDGTAIGSTVLLDCSDTPSLVILRTCLAIVEDPNTFSHCLCLGDNTIECYRDQDLIATIGLHHGRAIRWDAWAHDAQLHDGHALLNWLADRGVSGPLQAYQEQQQQAEEAQHARTRWYAAMPACLQPYWPQMHDFEVDLAPLRHSLFITYADRVDCIGALFAWFGSGQGPWSGCPLYEQVAEQLLLDFPTNELVEALRHYSMTPAQLEGAARYFAGWQFRTHKPGDIQQIPADVRQRLLRHSLMSSNSDTVQRAQNAFG